MEGLAKPGRLSRQGSRVRRHRSQEWQDYSSSDNEDHHQHIESNRPYRYTPATTDEAYDEQRAIEARKHGVDRGRGRGTNGRSYSHSSMELLTGRNYFSGSDGELEVAGDELIYPPGPPSAINATAPLQNQGKYQAYGSLPGQPNQGNNRDQQPPTIPPQNQPGCRETRSGSTTTLQGGNPNNSRGRMSLSLRRGPSSSSTSDNNSDATFTDTEFNSRRRLQSQSVFGESPPEPAPPAVPPRNMNSMHHMEALGRRARLGYLESECESEPPYLPTMLTSTLNAYASQELNSSSNVSKAQLDDNPEDETEIMNTVNRINSLENERIYSPPNQPNPLPRGEIHSTAPTPPAKDLPAAGSLHSTNTAATTISATTNNSTTSSTTGATYSNPIPVFCSTPSSTTGPMVPVANCVNPQLIQPPTAPPTAGARRPFKATSAFSASAAAMASSRFHFRKSCTRRCSWKIATIVLTVVAVVLTACVTYFAAVGGMRNNGDGATPCIVVEDGRPYGSATGTPLSLITKDVGHVINPQPVCVVVPRDISEYEELPPGNEDSRTLQPQESWNTFFSHPDASFVRLNFSVPHGSRLAFLARKNEPPSITSYDIMEVIGDELRRYVRATLPRQEISFLHFLEPGTWYLSIINDDSTPVGVSFHPTIARDVPTSCPNNCHHHGNCHLGKCHCFPGYIGHDCADSVCPVHCSGHGRYVQGICRCEVGWKGTECNVPVTECEVIDCNNQGICVAGKCQCRAGYKGNHCEEVDCLDPTCTGHGACVSGQCWCKTGWRGVNCSEADNRLSRCFPDCNKHGVYDLETEKCVCFDHWAGPDCSRAKCSLDCGKNGQCEEGRCRCDPGWTGTRCDQKTCDERCHDHGQCKNGTCVCVQGWMGTHCTLEGCPDSCGGASKGQCIFEEGQWLCRCEDGWGGLDCKTPQETSCLDDKDNDSDGLIDCADSECCIKDECKDSLFCLSSPDPLDILLRKQPPAVTATFYQKMKFLIEEDSVQSYAHRDEYSESQFWTAFSKSRVSVARGQVVNKEGTGLIGVRVSVATDPQFGFTLTRPDGWFDILVNGGSAVTIQFQRSPFHPIKKTVLVPWNDIVVMPPVVMSALVDTDTPSVPSPPESCLDHDYDYMKPIVYQTWRPVSEGGCTENSAIIAETQVLQESLSIPGSDLHLVYHSSHAHGYLSTIHLQLTPNNITSSLRLVHLHIIIEGIFFEKIFEADPEIKFTYAWNKRNVYKQKVYGLTTARVFVGYEYTTCHSIIWTSHSMTLKGYDMDTSELGGWNLDIHHRYNFHEGVLQKGDGTTIYFRQQPRVISTLMGTGLQRPMLCPECNGMAREARLLAPVALASGPDGSVYVGDFNLIRRVTSSGQVYTVFRMRTTDMSTHYHITLSPTDGHLYISDPERHQILRIHSLDKVEDPESNFDVVVGSGDRCLPRDKDNCGDGKPALEARLSYPKGMAVAVDNTLYFADGSNIRMVDSRGIIHTLIGDHHHKRQWRPIPCSGTLKIEEAKLRWPTDLAINPLDNSLYFIDDHMVLKLTQDRRVMVIAGHPVYCRPQPSHLRTRVTGENVLWSLIGFTFGPTGTMYLAEVDAKNVHRVRVLTPDGELLHFAGREGLCDCDWQNCTCPASGDDEGRLAVDTRLLSVTSIAVTGDGVVHIADQGNLKILSAVPYLPAADPNQEFQISFPEHHEIYVFNKYGQHVTTRNVLTGRTVYSFHYNVNTSFGKLSAVTDASGNKVAFLRDQGNGLHTVETARGQKCRVQMGRQGALEVFVDPDNMETSFDYDGNGLLTSRSDAAGRSFFYVYDENGRLTRVVKPSGQEMQLTFDLGPDGASVVSTDQNKGEHSVVTVKGNTVVSQQGSAPVETTIHQDGVIEVETPWQQGLVWESLPHPVLMGSLPVQAGMFPVPLRLTSFEGEEKHTVSSWNYDIKFNRKDKEKTIAAVERILMINDTQLLTVEYDWVAGREILYNSSRRPFLVVQYDSFSRPVQWLPTDTRLPLNLMYERLGRLSGWQQGPLSESYSYDRMGHLTEVKNPDNSAMKYSYDLKTMPSKITLPSGRKFTYHYDDNGGLKYVTTPKGSRHTFTAYVSIGFYKLLYTPPGNTGSYVVHFNDQRLPLLKTYPGDLGRALYKYNDRMMLIAIVYGGGKIERNYSESGFINYEAWHTQDVEIISQFFYKGSSLVKWRMNFNSPFPLTNAMFTYNYDGMRRPVTISAKIGNVQLQSIDFSTNMTTGKKDQIGPFRCYERFHNESVISDGVASVTRQVDPLYRLKFLSIVISDKEVYRVDMQYDNRNAVTQSKIYMKHLGVSKVRVQNYSYDEDGQLVEMVGRDHWKFHYDQNGNMITMQYMGNKIDILHDAGDRIVSFGETPYVLDGRGFVTQRGEERFVYNTKRQLTRAFRVGRYDIDYYYDGRGRLSVRKDNVGNVTQFFYADPGQPFAVTHIYNNADGRTITLLYDDRNYPVFILLNKESFYIATDHTGSPLLVYDVYGDVVKEIHRGPYGHVLFDSNPNFYLPVDFQGGLLDPMTGLIHFGDRVYDSLVGQWMTPGWDDILKSLSNPKRLHLYRFNENDPVNVSPGLKNKLDLKEWIRYQGINLDSLDLAADEVYNRYPHHQESSDFEPLFLDLPTVPLMSGLTCSAQMKLRKFARLTSVQTSRVKREQLCDDSSLPKISTHNVPFGKGITVSSIGGRAVVRASARAEIIRKDVFSAVFNNCHILDLHLTFHDQDVFYLVKDNTWRVGDDLNQLQRLGNSAVNTTVHESKQEEGDVQGPQGSGHQHQVDVRIHSHHAILNIRYGTTPDRERQRLLRHAKRQAVSHRWSQERDIISSNQRGPLRWTEREKEQILSTGYANGFRGEYFHDVTLYPELADDPSNIVFHKNNDRHNKR